MQDMRDQGTGAAAAVMGALLGAGESARWKVQTEYAEYQGDWTAAEIEAGLAGKAKRRKVIGNLLTTAGATALLTALIGGSITAYSNANAAIGVGDGALVATSASPTFTNASTSVTLSNTTGVAVGGYIRLRSDGNWYKVASFVANTSVTLSTAYTGTTGTGAGDTVAAEAVGDTNLFASSGNRVRVAMDATYPSVSGAVVTFRCTLGGSVANFEINEFGVFNNVTDGSGTMLNHKVAYLGKKASGNTATLTITITLS